MEAIFDKAKLYVLLHDFYTVTGLRCVLFDEKGTSVLWYPEDLPRFCQLVRTNPEGEPNCFLCDQKACGMAQKKQALIYACHAGLIEVITPIVVDDAIVGYLLLSHIVQGADEDAEWDYVQKCCARYDILGDELFEAYQQLPRTPFPRLKAASNLLALAATTVYQERLAWLTPGSPQVRLNRFLNDHLSEDLSSDRLCRELNISRATLYNLSKQFYGCSISRKVTQLRIQQAIQLLMNTKLSNKEICDAIGINDYNYFYRVFRKETGFSPRYYRERASGLIVEDQVVQF